MLTENWEGRKLVSAKVVCAFLLNQNILWLEKKSVTKISWVVLHSHPDKFRIFLLGLQRNELKMPVLGEFTCTKSEITDFCHRKNIAIWCTGLLEIYKNHKK
jgi:hypothetical protein